RHITVDIQRSRATPHSHSYAGCLIHGEVVESLSGCRAVDALSSTTIEVHRVAIGCKRAAVVGPVAGNVHGCSIGALQRLTAINLDIVEGTGGAYERPSLN